LVWEQHFLEVGNHSNLVEDFCAARFDFTYSGSPNSSKLIKYVIVLHLWIVLVLSSSSSSSAGRSPFTEALSVSLSVRGRVSLHAFRDHVKVAIRSLLPTTTLVICGGVEDDALISFDHMIRIRYLSQLRGLRCCCGAATPGFLRGF
jgi:hypothetical protein